MCTFKVYFLTVKAARWDTVAVRIITLKVHHSKYGQGKPRMPGEISAITDLLAFVVFCSRCFLFTAFTTRPNFFAMRDSFKCQRLSKTSWHYGEGVSPSTNKAFNAVLF